MKNPNNIFIATLMCLIVIIVFTSFTPESYDRRCEKANGSVHTFYNNWACVDSLTGERISVE